MERTKIKGSTNIAEIGYDFDNVTLEIKFHSGAIYKYWPITQAGFVNFMGAESKGSYFSRNIRSNPDIQYQKVDELQADE